MTYEGKKSTDKWFPVVLIDDDDFLTAKTGVAFGDVTCKYSFEGATSLTTYTVTATEWKEAGEGKYWLLIGASEFTAEGKYEVSVTVTDAIVYNFTVEVRDKTIAESMNDVDSILTLSNARITLTGTASAGSATTITLTGGVATDGYYDGQFVIITAGTGVGQARTILSYTSGLVATVTRDWAVAPSIDSVFYVLGADVPAILEAGTAQAGAASSITLDTNASGIADTYKNNFIMITAGTGIGQTRLISAYNASQVASVLPDWTTTPDNTSVYQVLPAARVDVGGWAGSLATLTGGKPDVNVVTSDVMNTDAVAELGSLPGTSPTLVQMIQFVYQSLRNKITQTGTTKTMFKNDGSTSLGTATVADDNTTFTRNRVN
jgi:hypothetical protein